MNRVKGGRARRETLAQAWKMLKVNIRRNVYYIEAINRYAVSYGQSLLDQKWSGATVGSGSVTLPLHLFSLSAAPNQINGNSLYPTGQYVLQRTSASGQMTFAGYGQWNQLTADTSTVESLPGTNDVLKGVKVKMVLYGALTRPTMWRIDLVQIIKPSDHPDWLLANGNAYNTGGTPGNNEAANQVNAATAFYEELVRPYAFSPATFSNGDATKGRIKYLKSWYHTIQPRLTTEMADVTASGMTDTVTSVPHTHVFDIWHQFNRQQRYDWERTVAKAENTGSTGEAPSIEVGDVRTDVAPPARVYLMVRAYNQVAGVNSTFDVGCHTSYDYSMRTYHEALN